MKIHEKTNRPVVQKAKRPVSAFVFAGLLLLCSHHGWSQNDHAIHANIIYRFTKYINWPEEKRSGEFVIGIVGQTPLYEELKSYTSNKTAAGQPIVVYKISASAGSYNCHIIFISNEESRSIKKIAAATAATPTLLVSESDAVAREGSCINFIEVADRLKLEINKSIIEKRKLEIAIELLSLGIVVK
jgi:hypothetical protein